MVYTFDAFELDGPRAELRREGQVVHLEPKTFALLQVLVANADRVVTKDEIFDQIWPGVFVTEASLSGAIKHIRKALGDDGVAQRYIRTVRGKGFRFVADLSAGQAVQPATAAVPVPQPPADDGPPVIAVLPFVLIATDAQHAAIAEGLPSELISALSGLRGFKVIARGSSFQFDPGTPDYAAIHQTLGAGYVLAGSVELQDRQLTVVAELMDAKTAHVVWADRFAGVIDDVFAMRQTIVSAVCSAVETQVPIAEADKLLRAPTENLSAWGHYHVGLHHLLWYRGTHNDVSKYHMQQAIALDPHFARAHSALAYSELEDHNFLLSGDSAKSQSTGMALAEKAVDLDPFDPFCSLVLSRAQWVARDLDSALGWAGRSVQLNHNYAPGHYELGKFNAIACMGRTADRFAATALSLSPLDPHVSGMLSTRALAAFVRDDAEAAAKFAAASLNAPNRHTFVCALAAAIYCAQGDMVRAEGALDKLGDRRASFNLSLMEHLFSLKDSERQQALVTAFVRLGVT